MPPAQLFTEGLSVLWHATRVHGSGSKAALHAPDACQDEQLGLVGQGVLKAGALAHREVDHRQLRLVLQEAKN